jgi:hypothetical protein
VMAKPSYIVEIRHRSGNYLAEVDFDRADRSTVLSDLLAGQYEGAARVYRLEDATAEFSRAISRRCADDGEEVPSWLCDLVENGNELCCTLQPIAHSAHAGPDRRHCHDEFSEAAFHEPR